MDKLITELCALLYTKNNNILLIIIISNYKIEKEKEKEKNYYELFLTLFSICLNSLKQITPSLSRSISSII